MKLKEISNKEFKKIADKSPEITFHQTESWANLKETNGWINYFVKYDDNTCALLLAKKMPIINKYIFYSPRGFLIDYNNKELLKDFTKEIKEFIKSKNGIFVKIDPNVEYIERDNDGNIVENGYNNKKAHKNLVSLGYKHYGFNLMQDTLQPRWMHVIETNRSLDEVNSEMESKTRQILRKNIRSGIHVHDIKKEELKDFKEIMEKTAERRAFIDRPFKYYENMWKHLHDSGILKIMIADIDFNEYKENTKKELTELEESLKDRINKYENKELKMNEKKYNSHNKQDKEAIERLKRELIKIDELIEKYGPKKNLGGILFLVYGNEVLSLYGGSDEELMQFKSAYTVHYEGVKYAVENNYKRYNFYGITGDFRETNPLYGLYLFKKSFGGHVVELIGEYDLVVNKPLYHLYKIAYGLYHGVKKIGKK